MRPFDPLGALRSLREHEVDFVLIGGIAARLFGSPTVTGDLDICHSLTEENLRRLAEALTGMDARMRDAEDADVPFDEHLLGSTHNLTLATRFGALDCMGAPAGGRTYEELVRTADVMEIEGAPLYVCSLTDLIEMKRASGRPKDLIELEILGAIEQESRQN